MKQPIWYDDFMRAVDVKKFNLINIAKELIFHHGVRYVVYFRIAQNSKRKLRKLFFEFKLLKMSKKYGIEIKTNTKIGKALVIIHPYNITISPHAVLGDNINLLKGCTIGLSRGGKHPGAPKIGNSVYVGINSSIVGGITIGDDVLIGPNAMVNCDVPSHSIVMGNPCKIIPKENATKHYVY